MRYNTKYLYSENNEYTTYLKNKKFCKNKEITVKEHVGLDKETLIEYLKHLFDIFVDEYNNPKRPESSDIIYHYGLDRPDYYSLMNYFEVRYNLYLDVLKRIEDLENYPCDTMYTIHFNKDNCKFFNENKNEFVESYLTVRIEKDQT